MKMYMIRKFHVARSGRRVPGVWSEPPKQRLREREAPVKETEIAVRVIDYLRDLRYEVHQEVCGADIVAVLAGRPWIIECKLGLGLDVLAQAWNWVRIGAAPYVSVATPVFRRNDSRCVAEWFMRQHGIGWLSVGDLSDADTATWHGDYPVEEQIPARVHRYADMRWTRSIRGSLTEQTRTGYAVAGSPSPRQWTPFKQTCENIREVLRNAQASLTTREIVEQITHHYSSPGGARSRISHYLTHGIVVGVERDGDSSPMRWHLADQKRDVA